MSSAEVPEFISVDDYLSAEAIAACKHEYVDGWARAMTGATNRHNRVKLNCLFQLMRQLEGKPCQPYDSDTKVRIQLRDSTRFYYPDAQVVCDPNAATDVFQDQPILLVEVLSPSTRRYDLDEKLTAYLQIQSLECYLLLEQHQPHAIAMRRTPFGFLRETYEGLAACIDFPFINCSLTLKNIYDGIEFTSTCVQESEMEYERNL